MIFSKKLKNQESGFPDSRAEARSPRRVLLHRERNFLCNEKESRWRDSPPAACRFSDVIPYAAVRSPGGFCCIGNAVSYTRTESPAGRTLAPKRGRFSGHISLARSAHPPRRVLLHGERSFLCNKKMPLKISGITFSAAYCKNDNSNYHF